ncbi:MAG: amidase [Planctomycetota bacterium]|nr:MAG: amidase [Planctomycetota bacterium]
MPALPSIRELGEKLRTGEWTVRRVVECCLEHIEALDDRIHAWVLVDRERLDEAIERSQWELRVGFDRGPLHGVPVGIKDIIDVAGLPTLAGSSLRKGHTAEADAPVVHALREAGAVILGKTVTVEFACFDPSPTRNPWNLDHTPGGSSSGSAAAVVSHMCLAALGSQTGGSLVRPAAYCGAATWKPTFGRVSTEGVVPVSFTLDHVGPIARTVADLVPFEQILPPSDAFGGPGKIAGPLENLRAFDDETPRLGFVEEFFFERATPQVQKAVRRALAQLEQAGACIEPVRLGCDFEGLQEVHTKIMAAEAAAWHRPVFEKHASEYGPMIRSLLERGMAMSAVEYVDALQVLRRFRGQASTLVEGYDALIMPAAETTAPATLETTGDKGNQAPWSCAGCRSWRSPAAWQKTDCPWVSSSSASTMTTGVCWPLRCGARRCWPSTVCPRWSNRSGRDRPTGRVGRIGRMGLRGTALRAYVERFL